MAGKRVEIFTAGCPICSDVVGMVKSMHCSECDIVVYHLNEPEGMAKASEYGVYAVPAVAVDGKLIKSSRHQPLTEDDLREAGIG